MRSCEEFLVLSKPKPRVYELDGDGCVSLGVAPLDAGVPNEMVGWQRGFFGITGMGSSGRMTSGSARGVGTGYIVRGCVRSFDKSAY